MWQPVIVYNPTNNPESLEQIHLSTVHSSKKKARKYAKKWIKGDGHFNLARCNVLSEKLEDMRNE